MPAALGRHMVAAIFGVELLLRAFKKLEHEHSSYFKVMLTFFCCPGSSPQAQNLHCIVVYKIQDGTLSIIGCICRPPLLNVNFAGDQPAAVVAEDSKSI